MIKKLSSIPVMIILLQLVFCNAALSSGDVKIIDSRHFSKVFGETRNFRIFLPPGYSENTVRRYPVIYYYHGWSQRYFGSGPDSYAGVDQGDENNGDNIANYVAKHDVIVVKADGYNRRPDEEYYLRPYNVSPVETYRQFPLYFPELVAFIDSNYRTIPDREHRAISGLSMGGFMTFWIGGKYPHLLSAAGSFCGSPEFFAGPISYPVEYRHMDIYENYGGMNVRLNFGDQDFIRYYHRDLNKIWPRVMDHYESAVYKAAHSTCGLSEMFDFIMNTFANPPQKPAQWDHIDIYPSFSVWDYEVASDRDVPGFTLLENVDARGFRCSVRDHLPDGEILQFVNLSVTTPPVYEKNATYTINDLEVNSLKNSSYTLKSDERGCLKINLDGRIHEIGINKAGDKPEIAIASVSVDNMDFATLNKDVVLKIRLLNKGFAAAEGLKASLAARGKETKVIKAEADYGSVGINQYADSKNMFTFRINADSVEVEQFFLTLKDRNNNEWHSTFEIPLHTVLPAITAFEIADGRKVTVVQGGDKSETLVLGTGNGDGMANPGESVVVLVQDSGKLYRAYLEESDKFVNPFGVNERKSDDWGLYDHVGGSQKYSVPLISSDCPDKHLVNFLAEYWLPDYPNHIIRRGKISIKVTGTDKTGPVVKWIRIPGNNILQVKLYDGAPVSGVRASLTNKDHAEQSFEAVLRDDGAEGDLIADDNVFSFAIPERRFGLYQVKITAEDSFGNRGEKVDPQLFVIH